MIWAARLQFLTSRVLRDRDQRLRIGIDVLRRLVHANQVNIVVNADYSAILGSLDILLADEPRLVVEKAM